MEWLNHNSPAVQSIVTVVLALATIIYVILTGRILRQSRESSEAAKRSAAAAERTIAFMKQQHEEQLSLGPQTVLQSITKTQSLVRYWKSEAASLSTQANPEPLGDPEIRYALDHARRLSPFCGKALVDALTNLQDAQHEIEKLKGATLEQHKRNAGHDALAYLDNAEQFLKRAYDEALKNMEKTSEP